jgi:hypothetical protein
MIEKKGMSIMIETALTAIATAITTVIIPKAIEAVGKKVGDSAFDKSSDMVKTTYQTVKGKLEKSGTAKLLERAESNPIERNVQVLEAELIGQMEEDTAFADRLQELLAQLQPQLPELQSILDGALIKGELEIGDIEIENEGKPQGKSSIGKGLKVGKDAKFGNISIKNTQS